MSYREIDNFKLINIVGIDGAGKTTLARNLTAYFQKKGVRIQYQYCQYFAKLLLPLKLAAKYSIMRKTDEFRDYAYYNKTKKNISSRYKLLSVLYANVWLIDYIFQVFFKISIPIRFKKKLVVDRYIYDIAVNLSLTTNNNVDYAFNIISLFYKFVPRPDIVIYIDIPEQVAFDRKSDIKDIEYLKERRERYLVLIDKYDFKVIDGQKNYDQMLEDTINVLMKSEST